VRQLLWVVLLVGLLAWVGGAAILLLGWADTGDRATMAVALGAVVVGIGWRAIARDEPATTGRHLVLTRLPIVALVAILSQRLVVARRLATAAERARLWTHGLEIAALAAGGLVIVALAGEIVRRTEPPGPTSWDDRRSRAPDPDSDPRREEP